jgi:Ca2+-dependent lipid-binding protein
LPLEQCKTGKVCISAKYSQTEPKEQEIPANLPVTSTPIKTASPDVKHKEIIVEKQTVLPLPNGSLQFTLHKARDLQKQGLIGKADPYVAIKIGEQTIRTKTVKNNQNPEWDFDFNFDITQDSPESLLLQVFDEDIGKDDDLGEARIELAEIVNKTTITNQWIPLEKCKSGEVLVSAHFHRTSSAQESLEGSPVIETREKVVEVDIEKEDTKPVRPVEIITYEKMAPFPQGCVQLTLHEAKDLQKKGLFGKADPYVSVNLGDQVFKTKTINNNHNPVWNHDVTLNITEDTADKIYLKVYDEDIGKDDNVGIIIIDLIDIVENEKLDNKWVSLEKCKCGKVRISAEYFPEGTIHMDDTETEKKPEIANQPITNMENIAKSTITPVPKKLSMAAGLIRLTVHKARYLEKKGILGKADPYFIVKHGSQVHQSSTVNNNHNPE